MLQKPNSGKNGNMVKDVLFNKLSSFVDKLYVTYLYILLNIVNTKNTNKMCIHSSHKYII